MNKEIKRRLEIEHDAFLTAFEWTAGFWGFADGVLLGARLIRNGPEYVIDVVGKVWQADTVGFLMHYALEVGVPVQTTIASLIAVSTCLLIDGTFRNREGIRKYDSNK